MTSGDGNGGAFGSPKARQAASRICWQFSSGASSTTVQPRLTRTSIHAPSRSSAPGSRMAAGAAKAPMFPGRRLLSEARSFST